MQCLGTSQGLKPVCLGLCERNVSVSFEEREVMSNTSSRLEAKGQFLDPKRGCHRPSRRDVEEPGKWRGVKYCKLEGSFRIHQKCQKLETCRTKQLPRLPRLGEFPIPKLTPTAQNL